MHLTSWLSAFRNSLRLPTGAPRKRALRQQLSQLSRDAGRPVEALEDRVVLSSESAYIGNLDATINFTSNDLNNGPVVIDSDMIFYDDYADNSRDYYQLIVSMTGALSGDELSVINQGSGAGQVGVSGNQLRYEGNFWGIWNYSADLGAGTRTLDLYIAFGTSAASRQAMLRAIGMTNTDASIAGTRSISFQYQLSSGIGNQSFSASSTIEVIDSNQAPVISSNGGGSTANVSVNENTTAVTTVTASDADQPAQTLTYSITGGADSALFGINPATGVLTFNSAPNFEAPTDAGANNVYNLQVTVSDGNGGTAVQDIAVTVNNSNDAPVITSSNMVTVSEGTSLAVTIQATDEDGDHLTIWLYVYGDGNDFGIAGNQIVFPYVGTPDFEDPRDDNADNVYEIYVEANDNHGGVTGQWISITVTNLIENPTITSNASTSVSENQTGALTVTASDPNIGTTLSYSITGGADSALFEINPTTGVLTFNTAPNFEAPADTGTDNVYNVQVTVSNNLGGSTVQDIEVTVTNVNETPTIQTSGMVYAVENQSLAVAIDAADPDAGATLTYSIGGQSDDALFSIDPATGVLTFLTLPDFEAPHDAGPNNVYNVLVTVSDGLGGTAMIGLAIIVTNVNENPVITSNATASVSENQTGALTVTATDPDSGATQTYSITGGADSAQFGIDSSTGVLTFNAAPNFEAPGDADSNNVYNVQVTVSDGLGGTAVQDIEVTVTGVNENAPVITSANSLSIAENGAAVGTLTATDADLPAQQVTFSISGGVDAALFSINPNTGLLNFLSPPDFENPLDVGGNNTYNIEITVDDGAGLTSTQNLTVSVTNVVEAPAIKLNQVTARYLIGKENAFIDPSAEFKADATATDYSSAVLTVSISSNRDAKDQLNVIAKGSKAGEIDVKGNRILYGGVVIGTVKGGTKAAPDLVVTLNSSATEAAIQALLQRVSFSTQKGKTAHLTRTLQFRITGVSGQNSNVASRDVNVLTEV